MDAIILGNLIKKIREEKNLTQQFLADLLFVSPKTISKWERGKGLPDITLLEPLSKALGVSIEELLSGTKIVNTNASFNMMNIKFFVCPICHNVIISTGESVVNCHGISLPILESEETDNVSLEKVEDEYYISIPSIMSKEDYISFICGVYADHYQLVKLYPEGPCSTRFKISGLRYIYYYDIKNGLFRFKAY